MNAVIKYPGAKWGIAQWIIDHFPSHHSYLEPFFGSGGVLFTKPRSNIETVNDLDGDVVNLFNWIRNDPERLAHAIYWTPYTRQSEPGASLRAAGWICDGDAGGTHWTGERYIQEEIVLDEKKVRWRKEIK